MKSYTWTNGNATGAWNDGQNWSPQGVPADGDKVTLPAVDALGLTDVNGPSGAPPLSLSALTLQGLTLYDGPFTVTETLTWTGGTADADITVTGAATITGIDGSSSNPGMVNQHTMTNSGAVSIVGIALGASTPQFWLTAGSQLVNTGTLSLSAAGFGSPAGFGTVNNRGLVKVSGSCHTSDVINITHNRGAQLNIASNGEFVVGTDTVLRLAGGTVSGGGTLRVGDGGGGEIDTVVDTTVPRLVIGGNGTVAPGAGAGLPSPDLPGVLTVQQSLGWGHGATGNQYSALLGHLVLAQSATAAVENQTILQDGKLENAGHLTVVSNAGLQMYGALPVIINTGTLTMSGPSAIGGGSLTNAGLIEKTGTGVALLNTALMNSGNVAVNQGTLQIGDEDWTIRGGTLVMRGGKIEGPGLGSLMLVGGTEGGVLAGAGTVAATVVNGGWVEPEAPGLTITEYAPQPEGNIALPPAAPTATPPQLTLGGVNLHLDGSLWLLG